MMPDKRHVLMVQHSPSMGGAVISGVMSAAGLVEVGWRVDVALSVEGPARGLFEAVGCSVHLVPHCNWLAGGGLVRWTRRMMGERVAVERFKELIGRLKSDVVYINTLVSLAAAQAGQAMGRPVVWHIRELFEDVGGEMKLPPVLGKWIVRRAMRRLPTTIVALTQAVVANVLGATAGYPRVEVVPNAVDDAFLNESRSRAECRRVLGLAQDVPMVAVPGTLRPVKGHPFLLRAVREVLDKHPECIFSITGEGDPRYERELREMVTELKVSRSVRFLGTVQDMASVLRAANVVCIPSRSESFGRTVIEAMAIGTSVIGSDVGGIKEILQHERTGVLTPYNDEVQLAAHLNRLLADRSIRDSLGREAQSYAGSQFRRSTYVQTINRIVSEAACGVGGRHQRPIAPITQSLSSQSSVTQ